MNVSGILEALQQGHVPGSRSLSFALDSESTLTIGNIIKGKVMRHYDGGRYGVEFGGRERVVDSSIPLSTGEVLRGRVIAIDDKVHLQRIHATGIDGETTGNLLNRHLEGINLPGDRLIVQLFEQYHARLAQADFQRVSTLVAQAAQPELMALSALILSKMGSRLEPEFVRAIYRHLQQGQPHSMAASSDEIPQLATSAVAGGNQAEAPVVALLATLMAQLHQRFSAEAQLQHEQQSRATQAPDNASIETSATASPHTAPGNSERQLSERLFNVQNANSVGHRLVHFPLWLGERLVEIQIAFFAQQRDGEGRAASAGQYRKIVFSLETDYLGQVEVTVNLANRRARIEFATENSAATDFLSRYSNRIADSLMALNWEAEELSYSTVAGFDGGVLNAVVEHYITQDSVNRLM